MRDKGRLNQADRRAFQWLWFRAMFYMILVGGGWLIILPLFTTVLENGQFVIAFRSIAFVSAGLVVLASGVLLALTAGYYLIVAGQGTPFPLDPTKQLVTTGPYAHVRNPQAIAMVLMVTGEILALQSRFLWLLFPLTLVYLEVLVGPLEERQLFQQHGERYADYQHRVRKWIPQRRPYHAFVEPK